MQIRIAGLMLLFIMCAITGMAQSQPCQCKDRGDVTSRIAWANAAIDAYRNEISVIKAREAKDGKRLEYTIERRQTLQKFVSNYVLQKQIRSGGNNPSAETDVTCRILIHPPATPCMSAALEIHEKVHKKACDAANSFFDWKEKLSLIEYAQEEIAAYTAELAFLNALHISCDGWSGTVTYSRTTAYHSSSAKDLSSYKSSKSDEGSSSYQIEIVITGGTRSPDPASAGAELQSTASITTAKYEGTRELIVDSQGCSVSGPPVLKWEMTSSKNLSGADTQQLRGDLSIKKDGTYTLNFHDPDGVAAKGASTYINTSTGWCDPEKEKANNFTRSDPITEKVRCWGNCIRISGRVDASTPGILRGTWIEKEPRPSKLVLPPRPPGAPTAETVITWEIRIPALR